MSTSLKKIIILGSDGFVGGAVFNFFKRKYGRRVIGVTPGDIDLTKKESSKKLARLFERDAVVVFISGITAEKDNSLRAFGQNIEMVVNTAQALAEKPVAKLIYISTVSVYGSGPKTAGINEKNRIRLDSLYALAKYTGEQVLGRASESGGVCLMILRLPRVYGSGDVNSKYGPSAFVRRLSERQELIRYGSGEELREFLYLGDLIRVIEAFALNDLSGSRAVNIVSGRSRSFKEMIAILRRAVPFEFKVTEAARDGALFHEEFDNSKLAGLLPGFNFTRLEDGIEDTCAGFKIKVGKEKNNG